MFRSISILICLVLNMSIHSQTNPTCEKIYDNPDSLAKYKTGKKSLAQYVNDKIIPILGDCIKQKMEFVNSMTIKFTIDLNGKVVAVDYLKPVLTDYCKGKLNAELLKMDGWHPGKVAETKVCSIYIYPINCIKWQ
ncbi:MAG: hypothetical protein JNJ41_16185 [Bacteroidia bacterium]|nr:hypothetical protein [Bacteroidia bacterium]